MSTEISSADPRDRPQTMTLQPVMNRLMRGMLRVPGISAGIGKRLIVLYVIGRKSGKQYTVPVAYTAYQGAILIGSPFAWAKNLRTGEPVEVRYKGRRRTADVEVIRDESGVMAHFDIICRDNHAFAKFNKIALDAGGDPKPEDLRRAWQNGSRVIKLSLR